MTPNHADQALHVSSASGTEKTENGHHSGSRLTCLHELSEDSRCLAPVALQKGYAPFRDRCLLALPSRIASARRS